jgi:release factor glutamine methyltransferase
MITVKDAIERGRTALRGEAGSGLDAQVLLGHVLGVDRAELYTHPERVLTAEQERRFAALIERRQLDEPIAYLVGHKEFFGLDFLVDTRVLVPRPETELLVEAGLSAVRDVLARGRVPLVADIGTGSGIIPIALAVQEPRLPYLYACDISGDALEVARLNCRRHGVESRVRLLQGDLLAPLPEAVDMLIANLPYVGIEEMASLAPDVRAFEPHQALFSGPRGLDMLRRFFTQAEQAGKLRPQALLLLEIGYQQRAPLQQLVTSLWPQALVTFARDYSGRDRLLRVAL